ncbi:MAG: LysM peptidoglycan-binding domain-containing protein [Chitinophagaceae bacterium]|nr:MAG: LysM peptidoglycan-binding domain-containing protein [Chitinophagaceae bacterium]
MHKLYILLLATLFTNVSLSFASSTLDSIGVENNKGKKVIIYKVEAKETYYSIAKKYNIPYKDLMEFNDSQFLQIGGTLKVPTTLPFLAALQSVSPAKADFIEYTIKAKDNLNMLAGKFGTTVDEIKRVNELSSISLQIGQVLKIPTSKEPAVAAEPTPTTAYKKPEKPAVVPIATESTTDNATNMISHTIKAKENLNALAEKYGTTVEAIKKFNNLRSNSLRIGQVLKIGATNGQVDEAPQEGVTQAVTTTKPIITTPAPSAVKNDGSFEHIVTTGETIYSIAKKYNLTTYQLTTTNNLTSGELTTGQKLTIKNANKTAVAEETVENENVENTKDPKLKQPSKFGLVQFNEKGIAVWIADQDLDPSKMLVLHRTAPVGTIIKITNPMTSRSTYAKVVGKFTENETTKDVIIVMTKAVADAVGALDKRFNCNLNYGAVENEQQ